MQIEKRLQTKIITFLRSKGAYVIKTHPGMGTPTGAPDVFAFYGPLYAAIEVKSGPTAPYRPGQKETLDYLRRNGSLAGRRFVYRADPSNWDEIRADLEKYFF